MPEYIPIKENIEFLAEFLEIKSKDCRLVCSLCGEFVKDRKSFSPKMYYAMGDVRITPQNPRDILLPLYEGLALEREENHRSLSVC